MTSSVESKWKRFEALVTTIQSSLSPDAEVISNVKLPGKLSGIDRQIDILIRKNIGQFPMLIVLDCKDYGHSIDVKGVEEFIGLVKDVAANKGAMVAAKGYSETAKTLARNRGIDLYTLVDAEHHDWMTYIAIPVVCRFRSLGKVSFRIDGSAALLREVQQQERRIIPLFDKTSSQIGTPITLLWAKWNKGEIPYGPGQFVNLHLTDQATFMRLQSGVYDAIDIVAEGETIQKLYFGELQLTQISGFKDELAGALVLPVPSTITTDYLDTDEVEKTWLRIQSADDLAVKPFMILTTDAHYPSELPRDYVDRIG
jgi:restriction endonuclease